MLQIYLNIIDTQEEKDIFEYIYINFKKQMLSYAYKIVNNTYDAEDVVHNTFVDIAKNINLFRDKKDSTIYSYLMCATKGHALNFNRKQMRERTALEKLELNEQTYAEMDMDSEIEFDLIVKAIRSLDDLYSDVLYLHFVEDMKCKDIASLLGRKPATVKKQIHRGKQLLICELKKMDVKGPAND